MPFTAIAKNRSLTLLGEPGIGKSRTLEAEFRRIKKALSGSRDKCLFFDLRSYGSEDRLASKLFGGPILKSWLNRKHELHLFLDSLDECLLRIDHIGSLLGDTIQDLPIDRLHLRIGCRTADWPLGLETELFEFWGESNVGVFELAPLRRKDVAHAAKVNRLAPEIFLDRIDEMDAVPLAIKPITLELLINTFKKQGAFPATQVELYLRGMRLLCEDPSQSRRDAKVPSKSTVDQRFVTAGRVALATIFGNRYAIWRGIDLGDVPNEDITEAQILGKETETPRVESFDVDQEILDESLATSLFSSRGPKRAGWAHQTYAEFLAARYLVERRLPTEMVLCWLTHPVDGEHRLVPQLTETAAWLAAMDTSIFEELLKVEPMVLLRADVSAADSLSKARVVKALLNFYEAQGTWTQTPGAFDRYKKLCHRRLGDQLKPYISDPVRPLSARRLATKIAEACNLRNAQIDLIKVSLDRSEPNTIRAAAASTLCQIADSKHKAKLKALALGKRGEDPDDQLRGHGLMAVWPKHISARQLFTNLPWPKKDDLWGSYRHFLRNHLLVHLKRKDIPFALRWAGKLPLRVSRTTTSHIVIERVVDRLVYMAWSKIRGPETARELAKFLTSRADGYYEVIQDGKLAASFSEEISNQERERRLLMKAVLQLPVYKKKASARHSLMYGPTRIVREDDLPWLIKLLAKHKRQPSMQRKIAAFVHSVVDLYNPMHLNIVLDTCEKFPVLRRRYAQLINGVALESETAKDFKESYAIHKRWEESNKQTPRLDPPAQQRVIKTLEAFESSDPDWWWQLNLEMTLEDDSTDYDYESAPDLTALPGWRDAEQEIRERITRAAKKYVLQGDPQTSKWFGTNHYHNSALAGYRALRLLAMKDPKFVAGLPPKVWAKWAPIIVAFPRPNPCKESQLDLQLVRTAKEKSEKIVIDSLIKLTDGEIAGHGVPFLVKDLECCWTQRLGRTLLQRAKEPSTSLKAFGELLNVLLERRYKDAEKYAKSLLTVPLSRRKKDRNRAAAAAVALIVNTRDAAWPLLWPLAKKYPTFGRAMIEKLSEHERQHGTVLQKLVWTDLVELYTWLARHFPPEEDPNITGVHAVIPREMVAEFRGSILQKLENEGTREAVNALNEIIKRHPKHQWLKYHLIHGEENFRRKAWEPLEAEELIRIANSQGLASTTKAVDILVFTALPEEREAVLQRLPSYRQLPSTASDTRVYYLTTMPTTTTDGVHGQYSVVVCQLSKMGRVPAATAAVEAINRWVPDLVLLVGIAGGFKERGVKLGDVLVAEQCVDYEHQKLTPCGAQVRPEVYRASARLITAAKNFTTVTWWKHTLVPRPRRGAPHVVFGEVASGDKVVADVVTATTLLKNWPKLVGIEMEAGGIAHAASHAAQEPGFFMVRGVSDFADPHKGKPNIEMWRAYACDVAATYAVELLKTAPIPVTK